jgi:hypothetical protein
MTPVRLQGGRSSVSKLTFFFRRKLPPTLGHAE